MPTCDHVAFRVHDLDKTIAFYEEILPARLLSRTSHRDLLRSEIAFLRPEGQENFTLVAIMPRRVRWLLWLFHRFFPRQARSFEHLGFACDSKEMVDSRAVVAQRMGVKILNPPTRISDEVGYVFEVADPDNNPVEWTYGQTFD